MKKSKELSPKELLAIVAEEELRSALKEAAELGARKALQVINNSPIDLSHVSRK